jgi:hypothetical protein
MSDSLMSRPTRTPDPMPDTDTIGPVNSGKDLL